MVRIVWTKTSLNDLKNIANYIGQDSTYYAKMLVRKIHKAVSRLEEFPKSGRVIPEFKNETLREIIANPYRIFYLYERNTISILTIVHSKQDANLH